MPRVAQPAAPAPERAGIAQAERQAPLANRLVGDRNVPLGQEVFDITETQAEATVDPNGVGDDFGRESISVVARRGVGARMRAGVRASNRRARHLPMRYETGLPSSVIRFRT